MLTFPNAKINLGLYVTNQRDDGYHDIETVFYPVNWQDGLEVVAAEHFGFHLYKPYGNGNDDELNHSNLCEQAFTLLQQNHDLLPVDLALLKNIPVGAGLGGGSADAVFTLTLLNRTFDLGLSDNQLYDYARHLGSDCPFFLSNRPAYAEGRGEQLTDISIDLGDYRCCIAAPDVHIDTAWAYKQVKPKQRDTKLKNVIRSPVATWREKLQNDFEPVVFEKYPQIAAIKENFYEQNAIFASLSGSGAAVYGLFDRKKDLQPVLAQLDLPDHRIWVES